MCACVHVCTCISTSPQQLSTQVNKECETGILSIKCTSSTQNTEIESQASTSCGQGLEKKELQRGDEC